jgi:hypothetical protein
MIFEKVAQTAAQMIIRQNLCISVTEEKCSPKIYATAVIFKTLPKENNRPIGKNSPNLVTLVGINTRS